jgi:cyanuric acid amidohydrolase
MGVELYRFEMSAPDDMGSLRQALHQSRSQSASRLAIVAKTEGTATINDFGRSLAMRAMRDSLAEAKIEIEAQIILSTGSEGIIAPGGYLFVQKARGLSRLPGLALGMARSPAMAPADLMNDRHIATAQQVVSDAINDAGIGHEDVALVLAKTPLLTREMAVDLPAPQKELANSSPAARAATALGIGVAFGEIKPAQAVAESILRRHDLHTRRAMIFSGTETDRLEIIVLGNRPGEPPSIRSGLISDLIDIEGMARIAAGTTQGAIEHVRKLAASGRVAAAFLKASVAPDGRLRGNRTTVFSSDLDPDKHMRAAASGVLGALLGDNRYFVSGGAEHQAPPGGGVFAIILNSESE